jgi:hypothetical protein
MNIEEFKDKNDKKDSQDADTSCYEYLNNRLPFTAVLLWSYRLLNTGTWKIKKFGFVVEIAIMTFWWIHRFH